MADGKLLFETGIDNSGFSSGVSNLQATANVAMGNIAANMVSQMSSAAAKIPQQMINVGSGFETSMSQVAATMGITSAAAEFKTLSDAAKEMGETTKFSASQAGEALNYLALAGYDANKAVAALPTVLNVAAAGGMELASASDMITDAMSALGLETSQMADFSDKLAVTAQKSNTSVSQLGEAILTVGGTAKMLTGGVTEMNTARDNIRQWEQAVNSDKLRILEGTSALSELAENLDLTTESGREAYSVFENLTDKVSELLNVTAESKSLSEVYNSSDSAINQMGARYAAEYTAAYEKAKQAIADGEAELIDQQETSSANLEAAWKQAEHNYATGVIATESELYRQKAALLDQYGNADLEDHWKYYEDLYAYQKESAENSIKLAEEAAREQADIREQEWNNIAHKQSVGLLSAEDAYREQLAYIKKYCPEYSDEWYSYYQTVLDYQRDAQQKQVDAVKDGMSGKDGSENLKARDNAARLAAYILHKYGLTADNLYTHTYWLHVRDGHTKLSDTANIDKWCTAPHTYKNCPLYIIPDWIGFKKLVDKYVKQLGGSSVVADGTFLVRILDPALNIRAQPSLTAKINGVIRDKGVYTIIAAAHGDSVLWGKLKSGAGWISLGSKYVKKI